MVSLVLINCNENISKMWHEARRQERKIRGMLVDYRKRAERRRDFYEKIKADPTQFLQVHGRQCKIHLDPTVATAADNAVMMPWQGRADNLIDRFDVRAHLDYIPAVKKDEERDLNQEERMLNYERYRIIAQNSFLGISEEKFLKQLHLEEQFGYTESKGKKEQKSGGAAIGFNYEDGTGVSHYQDDEASDSDHSDVSDLDVDLAINVSKMEPSQAHEMNEHGRRFGMSSNDFYSFLTNDLEEAESYRLAKEEEQEKALFSGRKSRRERRYHREKRLANRVISPPSYAAQASPTLPSFRDSRSPSKSPSPEITGKITYITSFGDEEEPASSSKATYADKVKRGAKSKSKTELNEDRIVFFNKRRSTRSRSRARNSRRSRSRSRRRSRSISRLRKTRKSRSRSKTRNVSNSRSRSKSRGRRSRSRSRDRYNRMHPKSNIRNRYAKRRCSVSSLSSSSSSSSSTAQSKSTSKSPEKKAPTPQEKTDIEDEAPKVLPRYYGRRRSDRSSSELTSDSESADNAVTGDTRKEHGNSSGIAIKKSSTCMTIIERLKRKRQALLNRQFKADKIAERLKTEREKQEQQTREDELREMAIKLRRRQREKRHANDSNRSSSSSDSEDSQRSRESFEKRPSPPRSYSLERESRSRHVSKRDSRHERDRDHSKDRRSRRESSRESSRRDRSISPRRVVFKDRWREGRDRERESRDRDRERESKEKSRKSLVDY